MQILRSSRRTFAGLMVMFFEVISEHAKLHSSKSTANTYK